MHIVILVDYYSIPGKIRYTYYVYILCILLVQAMCVFCVQIRNNVLVQVGCMLRARNIWKLLAHVMYIVCI